jgi:enoyl-CoA hydratase
VPVSQDDERPKESRQPRDRLRVEVPAPRPNDPAGGRVAGVALVTIDRPEARNALDFDLLEALATTLEGLDGDPTVGCVVLAGGERAFAAGADIRELADATPVDVAFGRRFEAWDRIGAVGVPLVAAVRGYALGGGCELAMLCDCIVAGDDARFGQPEIKLGIIPGAGGTQRLTRAVGKAKASELILTGRPIDAAEAERIGLVTAVVPAAETLARAIELAEQIAAGPRLAVRAAKAAIRQAFELPLAAGLAFERQAFALLFATDDRQEGMAAFLAKRPPTFRGR